jgi:hypothetical protein
MKMNQWKQLVSMIMMKWWITLVGITNNGVYLSEWVLIKYWLGEGG